jgi:hypothetical protein
MSKAEQALWIYIEMSNRLLDIVNHRSSCEVSADESLFLLEMTSTIAKANFSVSDLIKEQETIAKRSKLN